jgi:hypothetical protein
MKAIRLLFLSGVAPISSVMAMHVSGFGHGDIPGTATTPTD